MTAFLRWLLFWSLFAFSVRCGCFIYLHNRLHNENQPIPMEVEVDTTIADLLSEIRQVYGIDDSPAFQVILYWDGQIVKDQQLLLADLGIGNEAVVRFEIIDKRAKHKFSLTITNPMNSRTFQTACDVAMHSITALDDIRSTVRAFMLRHDSDYVHNDTAITISILTRHSLSEKIDHFVIDSVNQFTAFRELGWGLFDDEFSSGILNKYPETHEYLCGSSRGKLSVQELDGIKYGVLEPWCFTDLAGVDAPELRFYERTTSRMNILAQFTMPDMYGLEILSDDTTPRRPIIMQAQEKMRVMSDGIFANTTESRRSMDHTLAYKIRAAMRSKRSKRCSIM